MLLSLLDLRQDMHLAVCFGYALQLQSFFDFFEPDFGALGSGSGFSSSEADSERSTIFSVFFENSSFRRSKEARQLFFYNPRVITGLNGKSSLNHDLLHGQFVFASTNELFHKRNTK